MRDPVYLYTIFGTVVFAVAFRARLKYIRKSLFLFDTIGIALYTIVGVEKGIAADFPPLICIALGTMSACFGGVIRDILCSEIPIIFRKEIYATACIMGGLSYFLLLKTPLSSDVIVILSGSVVITIRLFAVVFKWSLPTIYKE